MAHIYAFEKSDAWKESRILAEGSSRTSPKDQALFYQLAYSSLMELLNQLIIAGDLNYISKELVSTTRSKIELITKLIASLRKSRLTPKPLNL